MFSVHIHHGKDKLKSVSAIESKDVIITTYQTLCLDFGIPNDIQSEDEMEYLLDHGYATACCMRICESTKLTHVLGACSRK